MDLSLRHYSFDVQNGIQPLWNSIYIELMAAAIPGMVLGLGYILAFNAPGNPIYPLYGTLLLIAICNVYYYHAQGFLIASTSLQQISHTFDEASSSLGASFLGTLRRITLPLMWPTLVGIAVFFFMRSMVTLSAVIFLITPSTQVAAVSVLLLEDRGAINQAAAFSVCIMAVVVIALLFARLILNLFGFKHISLIR